MVKRRRSEHTMVAEIAELAKAAYIEERRSWHGASRGGKRGDWTPGAVWDEAWTKLAKCAILNQVPNLVAFIHVQFEARGKKAHCPSPKQCYGPTAVRRWREYWDAEEQEERLYDLSLAFNFQKEEFQRQTRRSERMNKIVDEPWSDEEMQTSVLLNETNSLNALARYCLAVAEGYPDVAERYQRAALLQYVFSREMYDEVWQEWIPDQLRTEAALICMPLAKIKRTRNGQT